MQSVNNNKEMQAIPLSWTSFEFLTTYSIFWDKGQLIPYTVKKCNITCHAG
jgi:hypothetical protein